LDTQNHNPLSAESVSSQSIKWPAISTNCCRNLNPQRQRVRQNFLPHKNAAITESKRHLTEDEMLPKAVKLRQNKYLNNQIEQDHHFIKRLVNPGMGFGSFNTARRTLRGFGK